MKSLVLLVAALCPPALGQRVELNLGTAANEHTCAITRPAASLTAEEEQVFARVLLTRARATDRVVVEWVDPRGQVSDQAEFADLPVAPTICILTPLSIAGFAPASNPGLWRARVVIDARVAAEREFIIREPADHTGDAAISAIAVSRTGAGQLLLVITGIGFVLNSSVHVARFTPSGGWKYVASGIGETNPSRITLRTGMLGPGEYVAVIRAPDGAVSRPARLIVPTEHGYKLPAPAGQPWIVTQGPYGSFSHWNRSLHALDLAPVESRSITAMRPGTVHTHDLGLGRTTRRRSFGNYITIDHGDGEYSHYAHLKSGSFLVRNGEHVDQGQPLAIAGNSGYALGPGGGVHVHVHVTRSPSISAQSIPFTFDELGAPVSRRFRGTLVSANVRSQSSATISDRSATSRPKRSGRPGSVAAAQWWTDTVSVPKRASTLRVWLDWESAEADLDLHLVSPSGKHFGWYGDRQGYSGQRTHPEEFRITTPEPGRWRVSVQGLSGGPGAIPFQVGAQAE